AKAFAKDASAVEGLTGWHGGHAARSGGPGGEPGSTGPDPPRRLHNGMAEHVGVGSPRPRPGLGWAGGPGDGARGHDREGAVMMADTTYRPAWAITRSQRHVLTRDIDRALLVVRDGCYTTERAMVALRALRGTVAGVVQGTEARHGLVALLATLSFVVGEV